MKQTQMETNKTDGVPVFPISYFV